MPLLVVYPTQTPKPSPIAEDVGVEPQAEDVAAGAAGASADKKSAPASVVRKVRGSAMSPHFLPLVVHLLSRVGG